MKCAIAVSLVVSLAAGVAAAQDAKPQATNAELGAPAMIEFSTIDKNKDERVSSAEAQSNRDLRTVFADLDSNRDGHLSQAEYGKWSKAARQGSSSSPDPKPREQAPEPAR